MELKQLLCPEVLRWHRDHAHLTEEVFFNEYEKWFKENITKINESVENNLDKINEYIEKGNAMSKNTQMLFEKISMDDDDDDETYVETSMDDDEDDDDDETYSGISMDDEDDDDDDETYVETSMDEDGDGETYSGISMDDGDGDDEIEDGGDDIEDVEDKLEELTTKELTKKSETITIHLSNDNLYKAINSAFIALRDGVDGVSMLNEPNKYYWGSMDTTAVTDMTALFAFAYMPNADLSLWDVSNVTSMEGMFYKAKFNNDSIYDWNVSNCICFDNMFLFSSFNHDVSHWKTGEVEVKEYDPITGKSKKIKKRVPTPIVGANKNEKEEREEKAWVNKHKEVLMSTSSMTENKTNNFKNMKHILDYETFINEGFGDFIKKSFNKVKSLFKNFTIKIGDFIKIFDKNGNAIEANSPYTSLNLISNGSIKGVSAYTKVKNDYINDNVKSIADIVGGPEYYGITSKDSLEYRNYLTMLGKIEEHYNKHKGNLNKLNESGEYDESSYKEYMNDDINRVGFSAKSGGLKEVRDINSQGLEDLLNRIIINVPGNEREATSALIWGSPGIGKTTIPNTVIDKWNKKHKDELKSIMVIKCHNLTVDGFSIPMPIQKSMGTYLKEHPAVVDRIKNMGPEYEKMLQKPDFMEQLFDVSDDLPKTWLPAYRHTSNYEQNKIRNEIANGNIIIDKSDKTGIKTIETTEGGIILFDEFLRANAQVFPILMDILLEREWSGYRLGNKWGIIACSNRPGDDNSIVNKLDRDSSPVTFNRFAQVNFIPSFTEWKDWALRFGHFDNLTISFLQKDVDPNKTSEYKNWHSISRETFREGQTVAPTPRSWSLAMNDIHNYKLDNGGKISYGKMREILSSYVGETVTDKYIKFIKSSSKEHNNIFNPKLYLTNPDYKPTNVEFENDGKIESRRLNCSEICDYLSEFICSNYSKNKPPKDEYMMMMFNKLESQVTTPTDKRSLDSMYVKIFRDFIEVNLLSTKNEDYFEDEFKPKLKRILNTLPDFVEAVALKYKLTIKSKDGDLKISPQKVYEWLAI